VQPSKYLVGEKVVMSGLDLRQFLESMPVASPATVESLGHAYLHPPQSLPENELVAKLKGSRSDVDLAAGEDPDCPNEEAKLVVSDHVSKMDVYYSVIRMSSSAWAYVVTGREGTD
jgi:hypothetical protein